MQRFFLETFKLGEKELILQDQEIIYQLIKVLRSKLQDEVIFFDGKSFIDFKYKITSIDKKNIIFNFVEKNQKEIKDYKLILFQSLPNKIDKIEEIIQKGVEVGFSEFNFFRAERSQDLKLSQNKIERFNKIIKEAIELSNRNIIPKLNFLTKLDLQNISGEKLFFHTDFNNSKKLNSLNLNFKQNISIFIGPEGGFSDKENDNFIKNNFIKINLGNNILRTETAGIVVGFYILQSYLG
ncbi:MAG: RsmE family RNA methyltransferase [Candidatus Gracilibacteria bacterium]|nr:RsmE family RNA methyltransferase [Candidatus Gracilibacteria bacterium]